MNSVIMGGGGSGGQGVLNLNRKGKVTGYHEGAQEVLGYDGEELIGRHFSSLFHWPETVDRQPAQMLEASASDGVYEADVWVRRRDASRFRSHMVIASLAGRSGRRVGFLIAFWTMTVEQDSPASVRAVPQNKLEVVAGELGRAADIVMLSGGWRTGTGGSPGLGLANTGERVLVPGIPEPWSRNGFMRQAGILPEPLLYAAGRLLLEEQPQVGEASSVALAPGLLGSLAAATLLGDRPSLTRLAGSADGWPLPPKRDLVLLDLATVHATLMVQLAEVRRDEHRLATFERERLARDLHDGVIQALYGVVLELTAALGRVEDGALRDELGRLATDVDSVNQDLRNYIFDLGPSVLEGRPLEDVLQQLVDEFELRTGLTTTADVESEAAALLSSKAAEVVQIAREALSNIRRHAEARQVRLSLRREGRQVRIAIEDDGEGFHVDRKRGFGRGLGNIEERAIQLGGRLQVESAPGQGSAVIISVPVGREGTLILK
jgi:PAS domain S-box-containing protein